jgi:hypothetical protein
MGMGKAHTVKVRIHRNIDSTEETTSSGWKTHDFLGQQFITGPETEEKLEDHKKNGQTNYQSSKAPFQPYGHNKHEVQRGTANCKECIPKIYSTPNFELKLHLLYNHITIIPPEDSVTSTHYSDCSPPEIDERKICQFWCSLFLSLSAKKSVQTNSPTAIFNKQHTCIMKIVNRIDVRRLCS